MPPIIHRILPFVAAAMLLAGCSTTSRQAAQNAPPRPNEQVLAIVDGRAMTHRQIAGALYELAGDEVLKEYVLDQSLESRCASLGIEIGERELDQERALLGETLAGEAQISSRVVDTLRSRRGLGPERYERLLRRNAMLRALTSNAAEPDQRTIERAIENAFGRRYRVRLCVSEDVRMLGELSNRINTLDPLSRSVAFSDACFEFSTHPSADRGGLIPALSLSDPGYPSALLDVVGRTAVGSCSPVISTEAGLATVLVERVDPRRVPSDTQRSEVVRRLRSDTQRIAMQRYAQQVLADHEVIVLDRSLNWAWSKNR